MSPARDHVTARWRRATLVASLLFTSCAMPDADPSSDVGCADTLSSARDACGPLLASLDIPSVRDDQSQAIDLTQHDSDSASAVVCWKPPEPIGGFDCKAVCLAVSACLPAGEDCDFKCSLLNQYVPKAVASTIESCVLGTPCGYVSFFPAVHACLLKLPETGYVRSAKAVDMCHTIDEVFIKCNRPHPDGVVKLCDSMVTTFSEVAQAQIEPCTKATCDAIEPCLSAANCAFAFMFGSGVKPAPGGPAASDASP